jgi:hypothetical protein
MMYIRKFTKKKNHLVFFVMFVIKDGLKQVICKLDGCFVVEYIINKDKILVQCVVGN